MRDQWGYDGAARDDYFEREDKYHIARLYGDDDEETDDEEDPE